MSTRTFLSRLHRDPDPLLLEIEQLARRDGVGIVARETGRLLSTIVAAMQANRILEIGTSYGDATLWMGRALPPAGRIWTIDPNRDHAKIAEEFVRRAGLGERVEFVSQPALEFLPTFPQRNLDVIFIDAVQDEYEAYLDRCIPLLKLSGVFIVDHFFLDGRTTEDPRPRDADDVRFMRAFARAFVRHPQLNATILPLGDGVGIGARIR